MAAHTIANGSGIVCTRCTSIHWLTNIVKTYLSNTFDLSCLQSWSCKMWRLLLPGSFFIIIFFYDCCDCTHGAYLITCKKWFIKSWLDKTLSLMEAHWGTVIPARKSQPSYSLGSAPLSAAGLDGCWGNFMSSFVNIGVIHTSFQSICFDVVIAHFLSHDGLRHFRNLSQSVPFFPQIAPLFPRTHCFFLVFLTKLY